jgi:class 3 adenylate cyclase/antitoxin (DNA-binding transcriptional repressor) of toxin-antitoxin stability system
MVAARPETVTVLFTDVVGSTAWRARVGEVAADERMAELAQVSRDVVLSSGGIVVKGLGDGLMATFTSAVAALDTAAGLQAVAHRLTVGGDATCLRVGVSSGDMVRDGDDWNGAAAIEASRLCAEAPGGSVLVADTSVQLSRGRSAHEVRCVGERVLRGFESAIVVHELVWRVDGLGLPSTLAGAQFKPLVGRDAELARTSKLLDEVAAGGSATLFVAGEPGVGKTRLAALSPPAQSSVASECFTVAVTRVWPRPISRSSRRSVRG